MFLVVVLWLFSLVVLVPVTIRFFLSVNLSDQQLPSNFIELFIPTFY